MYEADMQALAHLRERRRELDEKLAASIDRRTDAKERGDEKTVTRERANIALLTTYITRCNQDIFSMERKLGVDPEGLGAPSE